MDIRFTLTLMLATLFVGQAQAATNVWDGFVTDTHCGTNCQRTSAMTPDRACVRLCVRKGSKFGLWYANHVYTLEPQSKAARYAAERVHVVGELSDDHSNHVNPPHPGCGPSRIAPIITVGSDCACKVLFPVKFIWAGGGPYIPIIPFGLSGLVVPRAWRGQRSQRSRR
jgi:hypothetical protein